MTETRISDETAIADVLQNIYKAWDAMDADAFVAEYTEDATAILPGSLRGSKEAIRQSMAAGFAGVLKGTTTTDTIQSIRFLGTDTAVVVSESVVRFPGETDVPAGRAVNATWVLHKRDGRWLIAAYHNSPAVNAA